MTTPTLRLRDNRDWLISPTQLATLKSCPRQFLYTYMHRRVRSGTFAARDAGKIWDNALNRRYREAGAGAASPEVEARMCVDIDEGFATLDLPIDEFRTAARFKEVVKLYNEHYGAEGFDILGVQVPFEVEVGTLRVPEGFWIRHLDNKLDVGKALLEGRPVRLFLHGILDLLIRQRDTGLVLITDTKTSEKWDARSEASYINHAQMKAYCWGIPRWAKVQNDVGKLTELSLLPEQVHGCMINAVVIRKPYTNERYANAAKAVPRTEFFRRIHTYSEERLEEWRADTINQCEEALRWVASGHFRQSESVCSHYFGSKCPFIDVCMCPKSQRDMILGSDLYEDYKSAKELEGLGGDATTKRPATPTLPVEAML